MAAVLQAPVLMDRRKVGVLIFAAGISILPQIGKHLIPTHMHGGFGCGWHIAASNYSRDNEDGRTLLSQHYRCRIQGNLCIDLQWPKVDELVPSIGFQESFHMH